MPTTTHSIKSLLDNCDDAFPSAGTWGYMTILSGALTTGLSYTANVSTNRLTTASNHRLVTGSRFRVSGATTPTNPLLDNTDYYAIVINANTLEVAATLANAQAGTEIDITSAGAGPLVLSEQALNATDSLAVLINKEVIHPDWSIRQLITNLGAAVAVAGGAEKPTVSLGISNTDVAPLDYQHYLFIESSAGTTATIGNVPVGAGYILSSEPTIQSIAAGDPARIVLLRLRASNR